MPAAEMSTTEQLSASGRRGDARIVKAYLEALGTERTTRHTGRTAEAIEERIHSINATVATVSPLQGLQLAQERIDLRSELQQLAQALDATAELEAQFVAVAKRYADRKGISYAAWRELGVSIEILDRAGITHNKQRRSASSESGLES